MTSTEPLPSSRWARRRTTILAAAVTALVVAAVSVAAVVSGTMDSSNAALVVMGFDPDRAQLITSLLIGAAGAAAATVLANGRGPAAMAGLVALGALFAPTFVAETNNALASTGIDGSFDLGGWLLTLLTLATIGIVAAWAGATLAWALRPGLIEAGSVVRDVARRRRPDRRPARAPLVAAVVLVLLVVTVPVFGDMVNYTPDARMLHGGAPPVGLIGGPSDQQAPASDTTAGLNPSASLVAGSSATPGATAQPVQRPWLSWRPSGKGSVAALSLPGPWNGNSPLLIWVYTPPGYNANGTLRYPVLYEAPTSFPFWDSAANTKVSLDTLIDSGAIPPIIVVFIAQSGAPYPDSECANSADGRQWMDTGIAQTVVPYVDSHYSTIASQAARSILGMSVGGYCAAILALHHPTVFGTSIPMSGYFRAGAVGATSRLPFGGSAAALAAASPTVVAPQLPAAERANLYFILVAQPTQSFYGPETTAFAQLLGSLGYPYLVENANVQHGWVQVRRELPKVLEAWAARMVSTGVFSK